MDTFIGYAIALAALAVVSLPAWFAHAHDRNVDRQLREAAMSPLPDSHSRSRVSAETFGQTVGHGYRHTPRPV